MDLPTNKKSSHRGAAQNSPARATPESVTANGRRRYAHAWHEIEDLYHKILDAYYEHEDRSRALRYVPRLEELLRREAADHGAILGEECWALVSELRGDLRAAITFRRNAIRLIRKLWKTLPGSPEIVRAALLDQYGPSDLADRYELLAILYHDAGQLKKAIQTLWQSRELCELHGIKFDGKDLLRDYLAEYRGATVRR
jgi:tetratricopeptide (TPR) repeat protein